MAAGLVAGGNLQPGACFLKIYWNTTKPFFFLLPMAELSS